MPTEYVVLKGRDDGPGYVVVSTVVADTQEVACRLGAEVTLDPGKGEGGTFVAVPKRSWNLYTFAPKVQTSFELVKDETEEQPAKTVPLVPPPGSATSNAGLAAVEDDGA